MKKLNYSDRQDLGRTFLKAIERFYSDPQNVEKFEKWKEERKSANDDTEDT